MKAGVCLLIGLALLAHAEDPDPPTWPVTWNASWNEETSFTGVKKYSGGYTYYDYSDPSNPSLVWARWDGWADPYCNSSLPLPWDTQCQHIVSGGKRYLYYPILGQCCSCCNDAQGCGVPTLTNATFLGQDVYYGISVYLWDFASKYIYYETTDEEPTNRNWTALFSLNDNYTYVYSWVPSINDPSVFDLPGTCAISKPCGYGACLARRTSNCTDPIYFN